MDPASAAYLSILTIAVSVVVVLLFSEALWRLKRNRSERRAPRGEVVGNGRPKPA